MRLQRACCCSELPLVSLKAGGLSLHGHKRDLADSLLEGTETAMRVSADDLLELLREVREK